MIIKRMITTFTAKFQNEKEFKILNLTTFVMADLNIFLKRKQCKTSKQ